MNIKTTLKSTVAVAALFAVAAPVANAEIKSGNKNSLTISGQVVRAIFHADDGVSDKTFQSGGNWTASRVRWIASGKVNENVTAGASIEMNIPISNKDDNLRLGLHGIGALETGKNKAAGTVADSGWAIRHQYVWVKHKKFGKLSLGNTDPGSNGTSEADFTGTSMFAMSDGSSYGSGITFKNTTIASAPKDSDVLVKDAISNLDGISRSDVIRYDTPRFMGLQLKAAAIAGGHRDVGLNYSGKFGPVKVKARAGYANYDRAASANYNASGSVAVLHDSGLLAAFATGKQDFSGMEDPSFIYFGVGYNAKIFNAGQTAFYFKWNQTDDKVGADKVANSEGEAIGFAVTQKFSAIGAQIGLEYMNYSLDSKSNTMNNTFDDIDVITLMTIFAF